MGTALHTSPILQEASRLAAAGGGLSNTDAIRLLHLPHTPGEIASILRTFASQLSREARSKLALAAAVPPPAGVDHERYDPLFERYPFTGETWTTRSGATVPADLQYYAGEVLQVYGECAHVDAVNAALSGSGYKAMTLRHPDGRRTALAHVWVNRFDDSTIGPYGAMFLVVVAVGDETPDGQACLQADARGATSVLPMLDGRMDPVSGTYRNRARLFMVRLIDSTRVAIDVGRERMGTDKRPGTVDLVRRGARLRASITDQHRRVVLTGECTLTTEADALAPALARAAATAGLTVSRPAPGTECVYPCLARIERGPVVTWEWRTNARLQMQPVSSDSFSIDPSSEEGALLKAWGFVPRVVGFVPRVRGVVTGLASPGGDGRTAGSEARLVEGLLPVLRLLRAPDADAGGTTTEPSPDATAPWSWNADRIGSLTVTMRGETVGATPDGLRINWIVTDGRFTGRHFDAAFRPGAGDWMRVRPDGVAIVHVQGCLETRDGVRLYVTYGGIADLGPDGYARALRGEYPDAPPVVVTPTLTTTDPRLAWLNRTQCIGVGRVDLRTFRLALDVYALRVGERLGTP